MFVIHFLNRKEPCAVFIENITCISEGSKMQNQSFTMLKKGIVMIEIFSHYTLSNLIE